MRNLIPLSAIVILSSAALQLGLAGCESSRTTSQFGPHSQAADSATQPANTQNAATADSGTLVVQPDSSPSFEQAFDAARRVLTSHGFELDRVDAVGGVITTAPKTSAGLATPWDLDQSSLKQEFDDFLNYQDRRVRIEFQRDAQHPDLKWLGNVTVNMYRHQTPGSRVPSKSATLWSATRDPVKDQQGLGLYYTVATKRDIKLERRLAEEIDEAISNASRPHASSSDTSSSGKKTAAK